MSHDDQWIWPEVDRALYKARQALGASATASSATFGPEDDGEPTEWKRWRLAVAEGWRDHAHLLLRYAEVRARTGTPDDDPVC